MPIIDSQVHSYERNQPGRPWHGVLAGPAEVTGEQMVAKMDEAGVDGAILVSAFTMYRYDASYALSVQRAYPSRFALVKPIDPANPTVEDTVAEWKRTPGAIACRPGLNRVLAAAGRYALPINLHIAGRLDQGTELIRRHPDTQVIVDHVGLVQPHDPPVPDQPWAELPKVLALAKLPNVAIKISGACTLSCEPYPYKDIWDPICRVIDAFGLDRCMWGTDWTRAVNFLTFKQGVDAFRDTDRISASDKAKLMGGTVTRIYGWAPER
jgi:predicted TIM-barrel fold metal-dependent hydrolase